MANRNKKVQLKDLDNMLEEVDGRAIMGANPNVEAKIGDTVYIIMPKYSRSMVLHRDMQEQKGLITHEEKLQGCIRVQDQLLYPNKTYEVKLTPDVRDLIKHGIVRGGGRMRKPRYDVKVYSRQEIEATKKKEHTSEEEFTGGIHVCQ